MFKFFKNLYKETKAVVVGTARKVKEAVVELVTPAVDLAKQGAAVAIGGISGGVSYLFTSAVPAQAAITIDTTDILADIATIIAAVVSIGIAWLAIKFARKFFGV